MTIISTRFILIWLVVAVFILIGVHARGGKASPRQKLFGVLKTVGCTNRVVARFIIDQVVSGTSNTVTIERLSGITGYQPSSISQWYRFPFFKIANNDK